MSEEKSEKPVGKDKDITQKDGEMPVIEHVPGKPGSVVRQGPKGMTTPGTVKPRTN